MMPPVEEIVACSPVACRLALSGCIILSEAPNLPSKPLQITLRLNDIAYVVEDLQVVSCTRWPC